MSAVSCVLAYALLVAGCAPRPLTALSVAGRSPRLTIAGWLTAAASVLLAVIAGAVAVAVHPGPVAARAVAALIVVGVVARLGWAAAVTVRAGRATRRRQRHGLRLIGRADAALAVVNVECAEPMVYCLPGRGGLVVVTSGARAALSPPQLAAVLTHERSHLAGRHHLLLTIGYSLARALPIRLFTALAAGVEVQVELRADDVAALRHGKLTVASAIAAMSRRPSPAGALGGGGSTAFARGRRLCATEGRWRTVTGFAAAAVTLVGLATGPYLAVILPVCATHL